MHKYGFVISAMLLTTVPVDADARKPFEVVPLGWTGIGVC
jgi:hypothetical protein